MKKTNRAIIAASAVGLTVLIGGCFWAASKLAIWDSIKKLWPDPWFKITAIDLYIGFAVFAGFVMHREKSVVKSTLWTAMLAGLGNIATLLYLVIELARLKNGQSFFEVKRDAWKLF
ncbi:DUF1475 domain-containing protein [bacterium]|nr:DUF1475 domain-containing protein [bacterium]